MTLGEKILNMRKARGWSQEELAERIGVTRQAVSRWESGSAKPDADKLVAVCDLFGVSADYLLRDSYSGETGQVIHAEPRESELRKFFRTLSLKQWAGIGLFLLGGVVLVVLRLVYLFLDTDYSFYTQERWYFRFQAFLRCEEVLGIWYGAIMAIAVGVIMMLWDPIRRWKLPERIRQWIQALKEYGCK